MTKHFLSTHLLYIQLSPSLMSFPVQPILSSRSGALPYISFQWTHNNFPTWIHTPYGSKFIFFLWGTSCPCGGFRFKGFWRTWLGWFLCALFLIINDPSQRPWWQLPHVLCINCQRWYSQGQSCHWIRIADFLAGFLQPCVLLYESLDCPFKNQNALQSGLLQAVMQ